MQLRIVERTISKPKASKYAPLLAAMAASLKADGADNRLRAVEGTAACTANGLTFRWVKAR